MKSFAEDHEPRSALSHAMQRLRLRETSYCQSILAAPWGLAVPESERGAAYVFVARGRCTLRLDGERCTLGPGDFALLPHGPAHELASSARARSRSLEQLEWDSVLGRCIIRSGGSGKVTHLLTGGLDFETNPILTSLPQLLVVRRDALSDEAPERSESCGLINRPPSWLASLVDLLIDEAARPGPGSELVLSRLAELLAIGAIREWLATGDRQSPGLLRALSDPHIRRALELLHDDPTKHWTLATLAKASGMSRSAFAAHFQSSLGLSPMRYYTRWRMNIAEQWLRDEQRSVEDVAASLGYASRAAFARAFKSTLGRSPGQARRAARGELMNINNRLV